MFAWYGGVAVDLRQATLAPDAKLTTSALFGGVAIKVPPGWRVEHTARAFAGGVAVDAPEPDDPEALTLVVDAVAGFGGVAIKAEARRRCRKLGPSAGRRGSSSRSRSASSGPSALSSEGPCTRPRS